MTPSHYGTVYGQLVDISVFPQPKIPRVYYRDILLRLLPQSFRFPEGVNFRVSGRRTFALMNGGARSRRHRIVQEMTPFQALYVAIVLEARTIAAEMGESSC